MINEPSGFVNIINNHNVMVLNCNYSWDFSYTVGHEISHLIDQRLTFIHTYDEKSEFSEGKWNSFNPTASPMMTATQTTIRMIHRATYPGISLIPTA